MNRVEIIDKLIENLKALKENAEEIEINVDHSMQEVFTSILGKTYARKNINIDITYNQLYVKDDWDAPFDGYKPYKK